MDDDGRVGLRVALITMVAPIADTLVSALRELGHEPVVLVSARRPKDKPRPPADIDLGEENAPAGVDLVFPADKWRIEPLLRSYEPDVALCYGYSWKIPIDALNVPRYGSANQHPAKLPRHRGPIPFAWAFREGDTELGVTWHRMDAELDTGNILARSSVPLYDTDTTIMDIGPRALDEAVALLPEVLEKLVAGDPGEAQDESQASWAGIFGADYATVDFAQPARAIHNQVRAWNLTFGMSDVVGPVADVDGDRLKLVRTSLADPGDGARRVECADGPLWILESEPIESAQST